MQQSTFSQDTPAFDEAPSSEVWLQKAQQFRRFHRKQSYFDHNISPYCDLDLEDSKALFLHMTLLLRIINIHTKFNYKILSSSEDIVQKKLRHRISVRQSDSSISLIDFVPGVGVGEGGIKNGQGDSNILPPPKKKKNYGSLRLCTKSAKSYETFE